MRARKKNTSGTSKAIANHGGRAEGARSLAPPVQKKILVKGAEQAEANFKGSKWESRLPDLSEMIKDERVRNFRSQKEVKNYLEKKTEDIGFIDKPGGGWIRLHDQGLVVLGEDHTKTTLMDIVEATQTDKFRYEAFTEAPDEEVQGLKEAMAEEQGKRNQGHKKEEGKEEHADHSGESFLPKMAFLAEMVANADRPFIEGHLLDVGWMFSHVVDYVKETKDTGLNNYYQANKDWLEGLKAELLKLRQVYQEFSEWKTRELLKQKPSREKNQPAVSANTPLAEQAGGKASAATATAEATDPPRKRDLSLEFERQCKDISALTMGRKPLFAELSKLLFQPARNSAKLEREGMGSKEKKNFNDHHNDSKKYRSNEQKKLMRSRDIGMFRRMLKADKEDCLLFGVGEHHRQNLEKVLEKEGIKNQTVETYLQEAKQNAMK